MLLAHGPPHQFRDDGALVLVAEGLVEFRFHFIRYTEIDANYERSGLAVSASILRSRVRSLLCLVVLAESTGRSGGEGGVDGI
jgi:hypothetical protein